MELPQGRPDPLCREFPDGCAVLGGEPEDQTVTRKGQPNRVELNTAS